MFLTLPKAPRNLKFGKFWLFTGEAGAYFPVGAFKRWKD